jgi:hypothetical protein
MRTPTQPFFKRYEIIAIVIFLAAAVIVGSLKLIY